MTLRESLQVFVPVAAVLAAVPALWAQPADGTSQPAVASPASAPGDVKLDTRAKFGTTLLYAQRYDEAIGEFNKVLARNPNHYEARFGLARAYFWTKRVREASEALKPLMTTTTPTPEVTALWNEIGAASGDTLTALGAMETAIKQRPGDLKLWESRTTLLTTSGCYGPAIKALRELLDKHPGNAQIMQQLAQAYFVADRHPEASELCRQLLDAPPPIGREAQYTLARIQLKARYLPEAKENLLAQQAADASDPRSYLGLITTWILDPEIYTIDVDGTLKTLDQCRLLDRAGGSDPTREWLFMTLGELVSHARNDERVKMAEGLAELLAAGKDTPFIEVAVQVLEQYVKDGPPGVNPDVEPFLPAIRDGSMQRSTVYNLAHLLLSLYAGEPLVKVCDAYLALEPDDVAVMLLRAEGLATTAVYKEADAAYMQILEKMPDNTKARRGLARNYSWYREFKKAYKVYEEMIEQDPTDMVVRREYARTLGWDKQLRQSLEAYDQAIEALGDDPASRTWKRFLTAERQAKHDYWWGYDTKARDHFNEAIAEEPANMEARFDLAQVYANNRHWEESAQQYEKILDTIDSRHRRAPDALYKNSIYHHPELRVEFQWTMERGRSDSRPTRYPGDPPWMARPSRNDLVDIQTCRLTETLKQEIARRTDLSLIKTQMWHRFDAFKDSTFDEYQQALRLDHRFDLKTYGHITAGHTEIDGTDEEHRFIGDFELTHKALDWVGVSVGGKRQPFRRNWTTIKEGIDENKLYVRLFGDVDPWLDWYVQYGHAWLDKGEWWVNNQTCLVNHRNAYDELLWGANYRLSLFPKILQLEYHGIAWWYDHDVPTYWAPDVFNVHIFRVGWRHYLNTDQYFEQRQFYYEAGISFSVDNDGASGTGYDLGLGWDLSHHFGFEVKWNQTCSSVYDSRMFYLQLVSRF
ncbi:MAG TPA: tetratricopeptide repeat protein [Phycisphaerae bacterium]|nr:tetratricopeptide repeat protein [Phycisphaerae bacterium]